MTGGLARRAAAAFALTIRAHPAATAVSAVNAVVAGTVPVAAAWLLKLLLDRLADGPGDFGDVLPIAAGIGAAGLVAVVTPYVSAYLGGQLRRRMQEVTQDKLFRAVTGWPGVARFESPVFYDRLRLGQQAGDAAPQQVVGAALVVGQNLITFVGFLVTLWALSWETSLIVLLAALPAVRVQLSLSRSRAEMQWWNSPGARRVQFYSNLLSGVGAAKEIRLYGLAGHLHERMRTDLRAVHAAERRVDLRELRGNIGLAVLGALVAAGGIAWTVAGAASGRLSLGDVSVFIAALAGTQSALASMVQRYADLHEFLLTFGYFLDITAADPDLPMTVSPRPVPLPARGIELRDVWFRYDAELPWVLRGVSLHIPWGGTTGLVGLNGAGKSTIVKLLCRFYDPDRGQILWDGVDLRDLDIAGLRDRISAVFQDFMCYDLPAADNIGFGDLARANDRSALADAARATGIHDALAGLPAGYDTMLSRVYVTQRDSADPQPGTLLSGGQWQRIALARGALRDNRDLLVLDEPSAGLDPEAEHQIHRGLRSSSNARATLLISHRLGTLREAEQIAVLSDGTIAEQGTHTDLMARGGAYARLFTLQASRYQETPS